MPALCQPLADGQERVQVAKTSPGRQCESHGQIVPTLGYYRRMAETTERRLALLMHGAIQGDGGKMGLGLLRYSEDPIICVIDKESVGQDITALTGIPRPVPIVASVEDAAALGANTLVPAIAPAGGALPPEWRAEVGRALRMGFSLINGLHEKMADAPDMRDALQPGATIYDVRQEPAGLDNSSGLARDLAAKRVLTVGTDMAIGKMTTSLELHAAAKRRGVPSAFVATGQIGICISGAGIPLDAIRVDFAPGAVEKAVLEAAAKIEDQGIIWVEGQGSVLHPASSAWLALIRGSIPTELILCHRIGQERIMRIPWVKIPPLAEVAALYEAICAPIQPAKVVGIALNGGYLPDDDVRAACEAIEAETGLPTTDTVRFGGEKLLDAVLRN
ncbi:hypothetical protein FGG08_007530 [Glutinoglossum americanum]|uniref:DUF1611 domain-containing protein n=1 Tax=Glutinoglossum americanum TaxID=1670608 RepID=A0A9P8HZ23_9PEZI|nr:hypothetical protein FGG08_007530 [Glutinoglossum americanum]